MADQTIDNLEIEIEASSSDAEQRISALEQAIAKLQTSLSGFSSNDFRKKLSNVGKTAKKYKSILDDVAKTSSQKKPSIIASDTDGEKPGGTEPKIPLPKTEDIHSKVSAFRTLGNAFKSVARYSTALGKSFLNLVRAGDQAKWVFKSVGKYALGSLTKPFTNAIGAFNKWKSAIGRIAFYRAIRSAIKMVTQGLSEGINNLYYYSQMVGTTFAPAMNSLATSSLYLKNSLGAMAAPLIEAVAPAINYIIDLFVELFNTIGMAVAALTGKSTFTKAIRQAATYGEDLSDSMGGAAGSAEEFKRFLIGIDELNIIEEPDAGGRGGGGGSANPDYSSMFEEVEIPSVFTDWAKQIRDAIANGDWYGAGQILAENLNGLINNIQWKDWGTKLGQGIQNGLSFALGFLRTFNWEGIGSGIATFLNNALENINPEDVGGLLASKIRIAVDFAYGFVKEFDWPAFGDWLGGVVNGWFNEIDWAKTGELIGNTIIGALDSAIHFLETVDWKQIGKDFAALLNNIDWAGIFSSVGEAIGKAFSAVLDVSINFLGNLELIPSLLTSVGAALAGWKISNSVLSFFDKVSKGGLSKELASVGKNLGNIAATLTVSITGFTLEASGGFDMGYNGPNWKNILKTGLGAAMGIGGLTVAFGAAGLAIGTAAALTIGVTSFVVGYNQRQIENELKERFGEIEITVDNAKKIAQDLMSGPIYIDLDLYVQAKQTAESALKDYFSKDKEVESFILKANAGIEIDPEEFKNSVTAAIESAQAALTARKDEIELAIGVSLKPGALQTELSTFVEEYYSQSNQKLSDLGDKLREAIDNGLADGVLDEKEKETIANLQSEINQIMDAVSQARYEAKINNIMYQLGDDLSLDSIKMVREQLDIIAQQRLDELESAHLETMAAIQLKYDSGQSDYATFVSETKEAMRDYMQNQAEISMDVFEPLMQKVLAAYSDTFSSATELFQTPINQLVSDSFNALDKDETGYLYEGRIQSFIEDIQTNWNAGFEKIDLTSEERKAIDEALSILSPSIPQMQQIADDAREAGATVPTEIAEGLHNYHLLNALTGDLDSINYLLGEHLSSDPKFLEAVSKAEDGGSQVVGALAQGLMNRTDLLQSATDTTDALKSQLQSGLQDVPGQLETDAQNIGKSIVDGTKEGVESQMPQQEQDFKSAFEGITKWVKDTFGIHSPSTVFSEIGENLDKGLLQGIKDGGIESDVSEFFGSLVEKVKGSFSKVPESIGGFFEDAFAKAQGAWSDAASTFQDTKDNIANAFTNFPKNIKSFFDNAFTNAKNAWARSQSEFNTKATNIQNAFTSLPSNIQSKFASAYTNAKNAWSSAQGAFKGVAQNVQNAFSGVAGNVKNKFVTAYNNAKGAWSNAKSAFQGVSNQVVNGFSGLSSSVTSKFSAAFSSAKSTIQNMGWYSTGSNIVSGILNGMYNIGNSLYSWASSFLRSAKNALQIHSPSALFEKEVGQYIGLGIAKGMMDTVSEVDSVANVMLDDVKSVFSSVPVSFDVEGGDSLPAFDPQSLSYSPAAYQPMQVDEEVSETLEVNMKKANEDVINVIYAAAQQIIRAINDKDSSITLNGKRVNSENNTMQKRRDRIYGT